LWIAIIFSYIVCFSFYDLFFFQNDLCRFYFFIYKVGWEFSFVVFFKKKQYELLQCFLYIVLVLLQCFPTYFFLNYLYRIYFFNIELTDNLDLAFPTCFFYFFICFSFFPKFSFFTYFYFFCFVFFRIIFVDFIFLLLSWLKILFFSFFL
jgi:hypothetical protein